MSVPVDLDALREELARYERPAYLITAGDEGGPPHMVAQFLSWVDGAFETGCGGTTARNIGERAEVSVVVPPNEADGYSLIFDATGEVVDGPPRMVRLTPSRPCCTVPPTDRRPTARAATTALRSARRSSPSPPSRPSPRPWDIAGDRRRSARPRSRSSMHDHGGSSLTGPEVTGSASHVHASGRILALATPLAEPSLGLPADRGGGKGGMRPRGGCPSPAASLVAGNGFRRARERRTAVSVTRTVKAAYMVMVDDAARAQRFYRDALAADITWAAPDGSWTVMDLGGREVCLHGGRVGEVVDTGLAVEVEDLEQACVAVERAGGRVLRPHTWEDASGNEMDPGEWLAIVTDTEGNRFCVVRRGGCFLHPSLFPDQAPVSTG